MSKGKELTVASLGDQVRDKVRSAMMNAIPDEAMDKLIADEFANFFDKKRDSYRNEIKPSEFQEMVLSQIRVEMGKSISKKVEELVFKSVEEKDKNGQLTFDIVELITPTVHKAMMASIADGVVNVLRQNLNRNGVY